MELIKFNGHNVVYAEDQPQYLPLPAYQREDGEITFCWKLSFAERIKVLLTGILWHSVLTFRQPLQPVKMQVDKPNDME